MRLTRKLITVHSNGTEELTSEGLMSMGQALGHNRPEEPVRHHRIRQARSAGDSSLLRQFYRSTCGICCSWIGVDERSREGERNRRDAYG